MVLHLQSLSTQFCQSFQQHRVNSLKQICLDYQLKHDKIFQESINMKLKSVDKKILER